MTDERADLVERLDRIGGEIQKACDARAYGLYDYSCYPEGPLKPHVVRDERERGRVVFQSDSPREARLEYERLVRVNIAMACIAILKAHTTSKDGGSHSEAGE